MLIWIDHRHGSGCTAEVGKVGKLIVERDDRLSYYKVRIFDHFMTTRFSDMEPAKKWAENTAKLWLTLALGEVNK